MRKGKRFTPSLLNSWKQKGRGEGVGSEYSAWHAVTRGDPGSRGKSRVSNNNLFDRSMDYLSDSEFAAFCFVTMLHDVHDIREQYPLCLVEHPCDVSKYVANKLSINALGKAHSDVSLFICGIDFESVLISSVLLILLFVCKSYL